MGWAAGSVSAMHLREQIKAIDRLVLTCSALQAERTAVNIDMVRAADPGERALKLMREKTQC